MKPAQIEAILAESLKNEKIPAHRTVDLIAICTELCSSPLVRDRLQDAYSLSLMTLGGKESIEAIFLNIDFEDPEEEAKDINSTDYHENFIINNYDYAVCLKVIRTVRNLCVHPEYFDLDGVMLLSSAHAKLKNIFEFGRKMEQFTEAMIAPDLTQDGGGQSDEAKMKYQNEF